MNGEGSSRSATGRAWSTQDSAELYRVDAWGREYFTINDTGHVAVRPDTTPKSEIDLYEVVEGLKERGFNAPILIRFSDILAHRLEELHAAFTDAIAENGYRGSYLAVYPIKVNQQRPVVEEIYRSGSAYGFGLEVGSKPELLAMLAMTAEEGERLIVCNGFKDDSYIEAVILAYKLGRPIVPVVENLGELALVIKHAKAYDVEPKIGVRIKIATPGVGRWRESSGAKSKFGLFISEVLEMFEILRGEGMEHCLDLVHCHVGSQLHDIHRVKDAVSELAHVYAELKRMGASLRYLDVGGGLGVDYDGSRTSRDSSINYSLREYANEVVYRIASVCEDKEVEHPTIVSESGRAIAAYQSLLVFNVLGTATFDDFAVDERLAAFEERKEETPQPIWDLLEAHESLADNRLVASFHDAAQAHEQAMHLFRLGYLSLAERGLAERLYWAICARVRDLSNRREVVPEELVRLETMLADVYFCNFSIFQSLPDCWAIDQLFPIMPIQRLDEEPTRYATLADMTCDSDGKINRFVDAGATQPTLRLHPLVAGGDYYLATFLVGAYQETLGDLHNLFGDTHVVHIRLHEEGGWWIDEVVKGDTAAEVLSYVQYDVAQLYPRMLRDCERAVRAKRMTVAESRTLLHFYESELNSYTYLEPE